MLPSMNSSDITGTPLLVALREGGGTSELDISLNSISFILAANLESRHQEGRKELMSSAYGP